MAEDLGQINVNKTIKKSPQQALSEFMDMTSVARPSSIVTRPDEVGRVIRNQEAKRSLRERLGLGMMAFSEGMTGRPFYTNYMNNELDREKNRIKESTADATNLNKAFQTASMLSQVYGADAGKMYLENFMQSGMSPMGEAVTPSVATIGGKQVKLVPDKFNQYGQPTSFKEDTSAVASEKALSGTEKFLTQFGRSYEELKSKFPKIGDEGFGGWMERKGASISNFFDELPETKAFQTELLPLANQTARDIEGGRITDQDRQVYADAMASAIKHPSKTNIRLVSNRLIELKNMGGDISKVMSAFENSNIDIMQEIVSEVNKKTSKKKSVVSQLGYDENVWEVVNE